METIQVVLDDELLQATDDAARQANQDRSTLVCEALREHLQRLTIRALEVQDREGYSKCMESKEESLDWEGEAAWPAE